MDRSEAPSPGAALAATPGASGALARALVPRHAAVALAYARDDVAPRVVAKGRGMVAAAIIERAREHGIFVHESKDLVALLMQVDLDARIPPELYRAAAELLAWVYRLEREPPAPAAAQRLLPHVP